MSGNDAAMALAEAAGGAHRTAVAMNREILALGGYDTFVEHPSGLDGWRQLTSAYDMALVLRAVANTPRFVASRPHLHDLPTPAEGATVTSTAGSRCTTSRRTSWPASRAPFSPRPDYTDAAQHTYVRGQARRASARHRLPARPTATAGPVPAGGSPAQLGQPASRGQLGRPARRTGGGRATCSGATTDVAARASSTAAAAAAAAPSGHSGTRRGWSPRSSGWRCYSPVELSLLRRRRRMRPLGRHAPPSTRLRDRRHRPAAVTEPAPTAAPAPTSAPRPPSATARAARPVAVRPVRLAAAAGGWRTVALRRLAWIHRGRDPRHAEQQVAEHHVEEDEDAEDRAEGADRRAAPDDGQVVRANDLQDLEADAPPATRPAMRDRAAPSRAAGG